MRLKKKYLKMNCNKIKHFVVIRFYCLDLVEKSVLFDENFLNEQIDVFEKYTLRSLENQTNKNFLVLILIHNDIDENNSAIQRLKNIKSTLELHVIRMNEYRDFLGLYSKDFDFMITTRTDHDDLIYSGAADEVQNMCDDRIPFMFNGYDRLITMVGNDYLGCRKFYPDYKGIGAINIFQSCILNRNFSKELKYNIFSLSHVKGKLEIMRWYSDNGFLFDDSYYNVNHLEDSSVYVKHNFNISSKTHVLLETKWHRSDIEVNMPKKWFVERFGDFID